MAGGPFEILLVGALAFSAAIFAVMAWRSHRHAKVVAAEAAGLARAVSDAPDGLLL